jgi:hypothetical protein
MRRHKDEQFIPELLWQVERFEVRAHELRSRGARLIVPIEKEGAEPAIDAIAATVILEGWMESLAAI